VPTPFDTDRNRSPVDSLSVGEAPLDPLKERSSPSLAVPRHSAPGRWVDRITMLVALLVKLTPSPVHSDRPTIDDNLAEAEISNVLAHASLHVQ
jgi:hypothetical protein